VPPGRLAWLSVCSSHLVKRAQCCSHVWLIRAPGMAGDILYHTMPNISGIQGAPSLAFQSLACLRLTHTVGWTFDPSIFFYPQSYSHTCREDAMGNPNVYTSHPFSWRFDIRHLFSVSLTISWRFLCRGDRVGHEVDGRAIKRVLLHTSSNSGKCRVMWGPTRVAWAHDNRVLPSTLCLGFFSNFKNNIRSLDEPLPREFVACRRTISALRFTAGFCVEVTMWSHEGRMGVAISASSLQPSAGVVRG